MGVVTFVREGLVGSRVGVGEGWDGIPPVGIGTGKSQCLPLGVVGTWCGPSLLEGTHQLFDSRRVFWVS